MDYYARIQEAIEFMERNLEEDVKIGDIAGAAGFSAFHFQRLFQAISGFSVHEYIRKRRLSEAAVVLKETSRSVLDIAIAAQYSSQEAFTRAFEGFVGMTPAKYRKSDVRVYLQNKVNFLEYSQTVKGEMNVHKPEIVELDALQIAGYEYGTTLANETYFEEIPGFYHHFGANELFMRIPHKARPGFAYGVSTHFQNDGRFSFIVGEEVHKVEDSLEEGFVVIQLAKGKYAEFKIDGTSDSSPNTWKYIYGTWLPNSKYERREGPDFEVTDVMNSVYPNAMKMNIYIPIE